MQTPEPNEVIVVALSDIQGEIWPTDSGMVTAMRTTLREGRSLPALRLNRLPDGAYEVVDGFHRYEALKAEGATNQLGEVFVGLSAREVRLLRIEATIRKPTAVVYERALRAIREGFVQDIAATISHVSGLSEPVIGESGTVVARHRQAPLPTDPIQALEVIEDHAYVTHVGEQTWLQAINDWLDEISQRLGLSRDQLQNDILGIGSLTAEGVVMGKQPARRARILRNIRDIDIRKRIKQLLVIERSISDIDLELALDWIGCGQNQFKAPFIARKPKSEIQRLLSSGMLADYANAYKRKTQELERPTVTPVPPTPAKPTAEETSVVFAKASPGFAQPSTPPLRPTPAPPSTPAYTGTAANYAQATPGYRPPATPPAPVSRPQPTPPAPAAPVGVSMDQAYEGLHALMLTIQEEIDGLDRVFGERWRMTTRAQADLAAFQACWKRQ